MRVPAEHGLRAVANPSASRHLRSMVSRTLPQFSLLHACQVPPESIAYISDRCLLRIHALAAKQPGRSSGCVSKQTGAIYTANISSASTKY